MGLVDLHCHLLWALDDGVETSAEALAGARLLASLGFTDVAPSPHASPDMPSGDAAACERRRAELAALLEAEGVALQLHRNTENKLDEGFLERVDGDDRRGVGETQRWVLVELPFRAGVPALPELVFRLRRKGVLPLFAHPERCAEFERPGRAEEVVRLGGALQLNVASLVGLYGKAAKKVADRLLDEGLYAVAATDLHHAAGAEEWVPEALEALEKRAGRATFERLLVEHPRRILDGQELA
ncbi:MAG: protein tyrosine phosphatase [Anaeromyxobacter sp.]|nr:protein tyrosine phosphatase [Anaeromyxobacter sp.]MBL0277730.1 protein tyrosine phosphatase [Anaeromyxobacter sp.]